MHNKQRSYYLSRFVAPSTLAVLVLVWQLICIAGFVPAFLLPSPLAIFEALAKDAPLLMSHLATTLIEAGIGLVAGLVIGVLAACVMDRFDMVYRALYPLIVISQTVPAVAVAPLLVLWFGYDMLPKVVLVILTTFFPITVGTLSGMRSVDADQIDLMRSMGATTWDIFIHVKVPAALPQFFAGLKISAAYALVGAVIAEWLGGFSGLGVYMTRVRKAYAFDKMFAVIVVISVLSLALMKLVDVLRYMAMPWERRSQSQTIDVPKTSTAPLDTEHAIHTTNLF
ncbi:ABC transporter permease [Collinsella sp. zg1085]|uniref:ABC transporter permease n=1 Tax=Collinsella sp. zg1085 TaxID=2844380 RepID=UPI001C0D2DFA|nr:ABC transporter permease [Collinsella sp. zg1085]QWT18312.1 ABC transporter permease [Collinsella sp. zg1085]